VYTYLLEANGEEMWVQRVRFLTWNWKWAMWMDYGEN